MHTNSLVNRIAGESRYPTPEVGMGATILMWTDRHAATIVEVSDSGKSVTIQRDKAIRTDGRGMSESQTYRFEPDPNGYRRTYTLRKNGSWVAKGSPMKNGQRIAIGGRSEYYDFSF